jgi:UDP-glucose:glycoprotein glucosyltransferase
MTKEPKLDRARRQIPEWNVYDEEVGALARRVKGEKAKEEAVVDVQAEEQVREKKEKDEERRRDEL